MTLDKEKLQTLKYNFLRVFGLSNRNVKDKQSKGGGVTEEQQVAQSFEQRISLGTELIKTKAFLRTHGRGS